MSAQERQTLVDRLHFTNASQRSDLLDEALTDTNLIAGLQYLVDHCPKGILITAVRNDHPTFDGGPDGHGHNAGKAVDYWTASPNDADVVEVVCASARNPYWWTVGLGGSAKPYQSYVTWPQAPFVFFLDNDSDHVHSQCANSNGEGLRAA